MERTEEEDDEGVWVRSMSGEHSMDARKSIYLQSAWDIYFDSGFTKGMTDQEWAQSITTLGTFNSIQLFWRYFNNLPLKKLPSDANVRFFKKGIKPTWDDPANVNGGKWVLKPKDPEAVFCDIALAVIGCALPSSDDVCGLIYSVRPKGVSLSIWNRDSRNRSKVEAIAAELREVCDLSSTGALQYMDHKGTLKFSETGTRGGKETKQPPSPTKPPSSPKPKSTRKPASKHNAESQITPPLPLPKDPVNVAAPAPRATSASSKPKDKPAAPAEPMPPPPKPKPKPKTKSQNNHKQQANQSKKQAKIVEKVDKRPEQSSMLMLVGAAGVLAVLVLLLWSWSGGSVESQEV